MNSKKEKEKETKEDKHAEKTKQTNTNQKLHTINEYTRRFRQKTTYTYT